MLNYGIIGNCKTCALVNDKASIHWMCFPDFDSPSVFAKLLDNKIGGSFKIIPDRKCEYEQKYIKNTNVIETIIKCKSYAFKVIDFFPRYKKILPKKKEKVLRKNQLIRIIEPIRGKPKFRVKFEPKLDYARKETSLEVMDDFIKVKHDIRNLRLYSNAGMYGILNDDIIDLNQRKYFVICEKEEDCSIKYCLSLLKWTKYYWKKWVDTLVLPQKNKDMIIRSALALKLLTYSETGAIMAASTTSIPEEVGGDRCFDYRFCWVRDAAFCVDAFKKIGRDYESKKLMEFIINRALKDDYIQPLYGIRGETQIKEYALKHLDGFKGSRPVRIGNAAFFQSQNDIYGEIIDIIYLYFAYYEYENKMNAKYWRFLRYLVNQIKFNWRKKDSGIWEFRGIYEHYTFSKFMCYVGVDRAIKLAQHFGKDDLANGWLELREEIRNDILTKGYDQKKCAFTIHYGSKYLDAANLLMTYHEFLDKNDPMVINTVKAIYEELRHGSLVQRYTMTDDFGRSKSAFAICSFWLVDALNYIDENDKATQIFDKMITRCNHLGLYSEDIDIKTKKMIGNFPQAYTHIALINSSLLLSEWSAHRKKIDWSNIKRKKWF